MEALLPGKEARLIWMRVVWIGLLMLLLYAPVTAGMVKDWLENEDMGHGFFVPVVAGYIVWQRREELLRVTPKPSWIGYVLIVLSFFQLLTGILGAEFFVSRTAMLTCLTGVLLATGGWPLLKALLFPLVLLAFMIRIPAIIYAQITLPLQLLASQVAETLLQLISIPVLREGNILELANGQKLSVVEACSGIRSLLSLLFLALVYGYFFERRVAVRAILVVLTVPIAIGANAFRVTLTGVISHWKPEYAQGALHTMEGWLVFVLALSGLLLSHRMILVFLTAWDQLRREKAA